MSGYCRELKYKSIEVHWRRKCPYCPDRTQAFSHILKSLSRCPFQLVLLMAEHHSTKLGATLSSRAYFDCANGKRGARFNAYTYTGDSAVPIIPSINLNLSSCVCIPRNNESASFLPSRLVDLVDHSNSVGLTVKKTQGLAIPTYVCLSYGWGGPQALRCETHRLDSRGNWILPTNDLPATFRDAFRVARKLGYRYIWVDSLCIVQNDEADVEKEILLMPHIYKNSKLTICASIAKSVHDQFLQTRPDFSQFHIPITLSDRSQGTLYLDSYEFAYPPVDENLASRAWALQERLLSPRVLEYGWRTVRWTCSCCNGYSGDTELSAVNDGPILTKHEPQYSLFLYVTPAGFRNFPGSREELFKGWARIVAVYSNLELSDRQDRLAAIGGITQELERITKVPYLTGLWKYERLSSLLLWNITLPAQKLILRPKPNRAPSWSWAAVDGPVLIHQSEEVADGFEIVSSSVSGGFSKTARGSIIIEGPSRTGKWWRSVERLRIGYDDNTTWDEDCIIYPDCIDELVRFTDGDLSLSDVDLTFIAIGRVRWRNKLIRGLILKLNEANESYTLAGELAMTNLRSPFGFRVA
ncbi:heterokaryon incompatibility protein-domain-containing protein [Xylaria longipes]|nr:heterokaryon incompatibility protein-domain-containing protein [Xylaria longipes]